MEKEQALLEARVPPTINRQPQVLVPEEGASLGAGGPACEAEGSHKAQMPVAHDLGLRRSLNRKARRGEQPTRPKTLARLEPRPRTAPRGQVLEAEDKTARARMKHFQVGPQT